MDFHLMSVNCPRLQPTVRWNLADSTVFDAGSSASFFVTGRRVTCCDPQFISTVERHARSSTTGILLTAYMKRVVDEQRLGSSPQCVPDCTPNLSSKGTTVVWHDDQDSGSGRV